MAAESKEVDPQLEEEEEEEVAEEKQNDVDDQKDGACAGGSASTSSKGRKKLKKAKPKPALTDSMAEKVLEMNPALKGEIAGGSEKAVDALKKLDVAQLLTGMV